MCKRYEEFGNSHTFVIDYLVSLNLFLTYIKKKLTMPFGTANLSEIGHRCNLRALDQQQQVPYQPRCPRTS